MMKTSKPSTGIRTVQLREDGQYVSISPPVPELVQVFSTARHQPIDLKEHGIWTTPRAEPLVWDTTITVEANNPDNEEGTTLISGIPAQQCFRGTGLLVETELRRRGFRIRRTQKPLAHLPVPTTADLIAGGVDHSLTEFITAHDRGIIRYGRGVRLERLIEQISAAWPKKQIAVVATRKADVHSVYNALVAAMPHVGRLMPGKAEPVGTRVIVATPAALGLGPAAIEHRHLYLALNPDELFSAGELQFAMHGIRHLWRGRLFGFMPVSKRLPPLRRDLVQALFGTDEHVIPAHGCTQRAVRVVFEKISRRQQSDPEDGNDAYAIVQNIIHSGGLRNRLISRLVCAMIAGDKSKLMAEYPTIASLVPGWPRRVVVYVDNVDHGLRLAHQLQLPLVVDVLTDRNSLTSSDLRLLDSGSECWGDSLQPVVVTTEGLKHLGHFDVVVRADGGTGHLPLPARHLRNTVGDDRNLLVIDFKDVDIPLLRHRSGLRAKAYRDSGWGIVGEPSPSPLEQFKANRPEVFR